MYRRLILKGARLGIISGLSLGSIYAAIISVILASTTVYSAIALGYFFIYFAIGLLIGVMPATVFGAISGLIAGSLISLEIKLLARFGTARVIFWRVAGLAILAALLVGGFRYLGWLLNLRNTPIILLVALYSGGLIWIGWRLYHSISADASEVRSVASVNPESKSQPPVVRTTINVISIILGLILAAYGISAIPQIIKYSGQVWTWVGQLVILALGVCSIIGLRTMHKWGA